MVAELQDKQLGPIQVEEHVFQDFDMFLNNYLLQGQPLNEIYKTK
jgi:hypothetical protein